MIDLEKEEFKAKLTGKIINFGYQKDRKGFFDWLIENNFLEFKSRIKERAPDCNDFYVYRIFKNFDYSASWIQDHADTCEHHVGKDGNMIVSLDHRALGYKSQDQDEKL